ncbi:SUN domain-containing protein 2 [Babesia sp. Xinjiang]|uniref:SUN domain-containing protein 2 n=1 Tax=Babesia sp. Xinjiang TaxID=462227 RepID=UPI000A22A5AC|nr:SUN domain-containing protein 2 [Babesia sp. Xinjiang]ORM42338.1 SUN domain-containing protein 2 [Babesia sp. Xinjiang]
MSILLTQKHKKRYIIQFLFFIFTLYICLRNIAHKSKNGTPSVRYCGRTSSNYKPQKLKGKPFDNHAFKLKVDFASEDAGAKIVAQSKDLIHLKRIQNNDPNSYLLAPCRKIDWFIISFPERISVKHVAFVSYEYYASTYKVIRISRSLVYPSEKWFVLAEMETKIGQSEVFDISVICDKGESVGCWAKYLKVEFLDFHNSDDNYYCSLTSMKVYGSTAVDVLESEIANGNNIQDKRDFVLDDPNIREEIELPNMNVDNTASNYLAEPQRTTHRCSGCFVGDRMSERLGIHCRARAMVIDFTIRLSLFQFMKCMASRRDSYGTNPRLYLRMLRFMKTEECGVYGLISTWNAKRVRSVYRPTSNVRCWNMMFHVKLPLKHTWFEKMVYRMVKQRWIDSKVPWALRGIMNIPLLICVRDPGLLGRFTCYSHFVYTAFTLLSTRKIIGLSPVIDPDLPFKALYVFFSDQRLKQVVPVSRKGVAKVFDGNVFVKGLRLILPFGNFSSMVLSRHMCALTLNIHVFENVNNMRYLMDLFFKSYVEYRDNVVSRVTKDFSLLMRIAFSLSSSNSTQNVSMDIARSKHESKSCRWKPAQSSSISGNEQRAHTNKRSQGHEHVLLRLSERVKVLETFANQLNRRAQQLGAVLETYLKQLNYLTDKIQSKDYSASHMDERGKAVLQHVDVLLKTLSVKCVQVVFLHKPPNIPFVTRGCIEKPVTDLFSTLTCFIKDGEELSKIIQQNSCHVDRMVPQRRKGYCSLVVPIMRMSGFMRLLQRLRLLNCCRKYGCICLNNKPPDNSYLLWLPHFAMGKSANREGGMTTHLYSCIETCTFRLLKPVYIAIVLLSRVLLNVYTLFICFVITQVLWVYRDRNTRVLIHDIYQHSNKYHRVTKQQLT